MRKTSLLEDMVLLGNIATSLMREGRRAYKLNHTQAQIVRLLAINRNREGLIPMTPGAMAKHFCMSPSSVIAPLKSLSSKDKGMLKALPLKASREAGDLRYQFYALTPKGVACAAELGKYFATVEVLLLDVTPAKTRNALSLYRGRLEGGLAVDAFDGLNDLKLALKVGSFFENSKRSKPE